MPLASRHSRSTVYHKAYPHYYQVWSGWVGPMSLFWDFFCCCFVIRILFPFLDGDDLELSNVGFPRVGMADPEDYLCIESGYSYE